MRHEQVRTPFGPIALDVRQTGATRTVVMREGDADRTAGPQAARAAVYGAKLLGGTRILEIVAARRVDRLLPEHGYAVPHDLVDLTHGHYLTFFEGKGYGFLPQQMPFCSEMRVTLTAATREVDATSAGRGVFGALDRWEDLAEASQWGAHLAGLGVSPTAFLAREIELCYVPLCLIGDRVPPTDEVIGKMLERLPAERHCVCATAMQPARARGLVGDDWREWV